MKILSIGNSFSQDAHRYLHDIAKHDGVALKAVNLYIGGCSLRSHYLNMLDDNAAYDFEFNGEKTGIKVSIRQALVSDDWDYVTLQQASHYSDQYQTYSPYVEALAAYVRKYCPHAKILIHQTWAYEKDSKRLLEKMGYRTPEEMFARAQECYERAAKAIEADAIIPCGKAMLLASQSGIEKVHRDTYHASRGAGRYLLALCWFKTLTGKDVSNNTFDEFDEPVTEQERATVINAINAVTGG
ncbi:MAG: DUF4886 domain-containing protein [Clostridia bacterium]|nr:DUF4886 domain-containing protein [Clostridia bacterium]